jgi:hypothetical protein
MNKTIIEMSEMKEPQESNVYIVKELKELRVKVVKEPKEPKVRVVKEPKEAKVKVAKEPKVPKVKVAKKPKVKKEELNSIDLNIICNTFQNINLTDNIHQTFIDLVETQKKKEEKKDIWKNSVYKDFVKLQSNNSGVVGEKFIQRICDISGVNANIDGTKTKKIGGGDGDGYINNKTVEIKAAHQGCSGESFQHELGEQPWNAEYMIFIDISPECIYLTIFENYNEESYKSGSKCEPCFPTKSVTWRKQKGAFKLDTTVSINEQNVINGYTLKITEATDANQIRGFIEPRITNTHYYFL